MDTDDQRPSTINQLFSRVEAPTNLEIDQFILFCIRRIKHLLETEAARTAFEDLQHARTIDANLAEQVNVDVNDPSIRNRYAAKAIAHAVCHLVRPGDHNFDDDRTGNARIVALYCQWAMSDWECPPDSSASTSEFDSDGAKWLSQHVKNREQNAQLNFVYEMLPNWVDSS